MEKSKMVRTVIHAGQEPAPEQIREIEAADARPVVPDEDAPELTLQQYAEMAQLARARRLSHRDGSPVSHRDGSPV